MHVNVCMRQALLQGLRGLVDEITVAGRGVWVPKQPCKELKLFVGLRQVLSWICVAFGAVQGT